MHGRGSHLRKKRTGSGGSRVYSLIRHVRAIGLITNGFLRKSAMHTAPQCGHAPWFFHPGHRLALAMVCDTMNLKSSPGNPFIASASTMIHVRVDEHLKTQATETLAAMGLTVSDAVRVFLTRVVADQELPFALKAPNAASRAAIAELKDIALSNRDWRLDMPGLFDVFDKDISIDSYYQMIRSAIFPGSTPDNICIANLTLAQRILPKGHVLARARRLKIDEIDRFSKNNPSHLEMYPPKKTNAPSIKRGRFGDSTKRVFYLASHPFVAMQECNIGAGDVFLIGLVELLKDMHFIYVPPGKSKTSDLLYNLLNSKDPGFYPVINKVCSELLNFEGFDGNAYDSVRVKNGHHDQRWGCVDHAINFAIREECIKHTKLHAFWLANSMQGNDMLLTHIFKPLSGKAKRTARLTYSPDDNSFDVATKLFISDYHEKMQRANLRLASGNHCKPKPFGFKCTYKK